LMAVCWALEAELTQSLQTENSLEYYPKPLFIGYLTRTAYTVWMLPWMVYRFYGMFTNVYAPKQIQLNIRKEKTLAFWSFPMMLLMFSNGYTWYLSLAHTPVSVNTAIYNCASVQVFLFSIPILNEGISGAKTFSVLLSVVGIVLIFVAPEENSGSVDVTWYGYALVVFSVTIYSLQEVLIKLLFNKVESIEIDDKTNTEPNEDQPEENHVSTFMYSAFFLGCVGVSNTFFMILALILWNYMGWEAFLWPTPSQTTLLMVNCLFDSLLYLSVFAATAFLTSPVIVALGALLVIPVTIICDYFWHSYLPPWLVVGGIAFIVVGFVVIVVAGPLEEKYGKGGGLGGLLFGECYLKRRKDQIEKVEEEGRDWTSL